MALATSADDGIPVVLGLRRLQALETAGRTFTEAHPAAVFAIFFGCSVFCIGILSGATPKLRRACQARGGRHSKNTVVPEIAEQVYIDKEDHSAWDGASDMSDATDPGMPELIPLTPRSWNSLLFCDGPLSALDRVQPYSGDGGDDSGFDSELDRESPSGGGAFGSCWGPGSLKGLLRSAALKESDGEAPDSPLSSPLSDSYDLGPLSLSQDRHEVHMPAFVSGTCVISESAELELWANAKDTPPATVVGRGLCSKELNFPFSPTKAAARALTGEAEPSIPRFPSSWLSAGDSLEELNLPNVHDPGGGDGVSAELERSDNLEDAEFTPQACGTIGTLQRHAPDFTLNMPLGNDPC